MLATSSVRPGSMAYAAAKLRVSVPTAYRLAHEGHLRTYLVGRARRVSDQAIEDCIRSLEAQTRAPGVAA
jgi:excisionase family DNA binding protein